MLSRKVFDSIGINRYDLFIQCSMFVTSVSIATVTFSLCSRPHFISTLICIINKSTVTLKLFSLTCLGRHKFSTHYSPCTQKKLEIKTWERVTNTILIILIMYWRSPNLWLWQCDTVHSLWQHLKRPPKDSHSRNFCSVLLVDCIIFLLLMDGRCFWTHNRYWSIFPFTFHSYT